MDVIGFLAGLAVDAISSSFIVSPVAIVLALALFLALSTGLAARLVEALGAPGGHPPHTAPPLGSRAQPGTRSAAF